MDLLRPNGSPAPPAGTRTTLSSASWGLRPGEGEVSSADRLVIDGRTVAWVVNGKTRKSFQVGSDILKALWCDFGGPRRSLCVLEEGLLSVFEPDGAWFEISFPWHGKARNMWSLPAGLLLERASDNDAVARRGHGEKRGDGGRGGRGGGGGGGWKWGPGPRRPRDAASFSVSFLESPSALNESMAAPPPAALSAPGGGVLSDSLVEPAIANLAP